MLFLYVDWVSVGIGPYVIGSSNRDLVFLMYSYLSITIKANPLSVVSIM